MTPLYLQLRALRRDRKLTIDGLAEASGVNRSTIIRLESRRTAGVDFLTLERLADALGVAPGSLIQRDGPATTARKKRR